MSDKGRGHHRLPMAAHASRQSKAAIAVTIQSQHREVCNSIRSLRDTALSKYIDIGQLTRLLILTADSITIYIVTTDPFT